MRNGTASVTAPLLGLAGFEKHPAIAPRAVLTERARAWAFEQVGRFDGAVSRVPTDLAVARHTVMTQVRQRAAYPSSRTRHGWPALEQGAGSAGACSVRCLLAASGRVCGRQRQDSPSEEGL